MGKVEYNRAWRKTNRKKARGYSAKWYRLNRESELEKDRKQIRERVETLRAIKENTPCADCGRNYPHYIMEFDHREAPKRYKDGKRMCLSAISSWGQLESELLKCDIVCANCHCARTWERKQQKGRPRIYGQ